MIENFIDLSPLPSSKNYALLKPTGDRTTRDHLIIAGNAPRHIVQPDEKAAVPRGLQPRVIREPPINAECGIVTGMFAHCAIRLRQE